MATYRPLGILATATSALCVVLCGWPACAGTARIDPSVAGSWTLVAADVLHPDGSRGHDYGPAPKGLLMIDDQGRYSLQIYDSERKPFASGDKTKASAAEYQAAVLGVSIHFGTVEVDPATHSLKFHIENATFPNWRGTEQVRTYELQNNELSYRVPPRSNGDIPISIWSRLN
jgi:hypothetical protein